MPKEIYGQYKYIIATVALLSSFSLTGISTSVFQSIARGFNGSLHKGFWANIRWSAFVFISALVIAAYYFSQGNNTLATGLLIGGSLSPVFTSFNLASVFLNAKKDFRRSSIYFGIIETVFSVGALAVTVLLTNNVLILVAVYFLSNTLATIFLYWRTVRVYNPDKTKTDSGMMHYAKHLSLMGVLSGIAGNIDKVLLFHFVGPIQLAIYSFAIAIPDQTKGPLKMLNTMLQAKFVNRSDDEIRVGMKNKMLWLAISSVAFIIAYILIAPYFYAFFFPNYTESVLYSQIYVLSSLGLIFSPAASYLAAKKKVKEQYAATITGSIFQIVSLIVGVFFWGLLGLILARVIIRIFGSMLNYTLYAINIKGL